MDCTLQLLKNQFKMICTIFAPHRNNIANKIKSLVLIQSMSCVSIGFNQSNGVYLGPCLLSIEQVKQETCQSTQVLSMGGDEREEKCNGERCNIISDAFHSVPSIYLLCVHCARLLSQSPPIRIYVLLNGLISLQIISRLGENWSLRRQMRVKQMFLIYWQVVFLLSKINV